MVSKKAVYDIEVKISEHELRHLMSLHAGRVEKTMWSECNQKYLEESADRLHALNEILKAQK